MTAEQFCYWLQGYFEMTENATLSPNQILMIKDHLGLVFNKVTPDLGQPPMVTTPLHPGAFMPLDPDVICANANSTPAPWTRTNHTRPIRYC